MARGFGSALLVTVGLCLASPAVSARPAPVAASALPTVDIERDRIAFGDLSPTAPRGLLQLDIGPAPAPGATRIVTRAAVKAALRRAGADTGLADGLAAQQAVRRLALELSASKLEALVRERLETHLPLGIRIDAIGGLRKATLARGVLRVKLRPGPLRNSTQLSVQIYVDERLQVQQSAVATLSGDARTPTLTSDLPRGTVVRANDLTYTTVPLARLPQGSLIRHDQVIGRQLLQPGRKGRPVRRATVALPPLIERGATVRVVAVQRGLKITRLAEAQQDGKRGQYIRVKPVGTTKTLVAKVISAAEVSIRLGGTK